MMSSQQATRYRGITARLNYLAADRPDIQFSVEEVTCRPRRLDPGGGSRGLGDISVVARGLYGTLIFSTNSNTLMRSQMPIGLLAVSRGKARREGAS